MAQAIAPQTILPACDALSQAAVAGRGRAGQGRLACVRVTRFERLLLDQVQQQPHARRGALLPPLLAQSSGLPLETVLMSEVLGFSNPILPYESPPLVVAMQLGGEGIRPAVTLCLWLGVATIVLLFPLDFLWWRWLGWI